MQSLLPNAVCTPHSAMSVLNPLSNKLDNVASSCACIIQTQVCAALHHPCRASPPFANINCMRAIPQKVGAPSLLPLVVHLSNMLFVPLPLHVAPVFTKYLRVCEGGTRGLGSVSELLACLPSLPLCPGTS